MRPEGVVSFPKCSHGGAGKALSRNGGERMERRHGREIPKNGYQKFSTFCVFYQVASGKSTGEGADSRCKSKVKFSKNQVFLKNKHKGTAKKGGGNGENS